ncbi:hypothetical protein HRbin33_02229 [bacterium HR33]|nr:hypothetical protein HRbin33_02229 [bacterium HR33]
MNLIFLAPFFLLGLAALAIPIVVHLTNRPRDRAIRFPSLMFIRQVPHRSVQRQRIEHWFLLLLRAGAVALLVTAFARPLLEGSGSLLLPDDERRELVILLDRSFSMGYGDTWERALAAARSRIQRMSQGDRGSLIAFGSQPVLLVAPTEDEAALLSALEQVTVSAQVTRYGPALEAAAEIISQSDRPHREVVLISDFQRTGWVEQSETSLPPGAAFEPVDVSGASPSDYNVAVAGVTVERVRRGSRDWWSVGARLVNGSDAAAPDLTVTLRVEGQEIESRPVTLGPREATAVRFQDVAATDRPSRIEVAVGPDPLAADNRHYAIANAPASIPVLLIGHPQARPQELIFLERALALGSDPRFELRRRSFERVAPSDLDGIRVVIANDVPFPEGVGGRRLGEFVRRGGGLLAILGRRSDPASWAGAESILPGRPGMPVDRASDHGARLASLDYDHPVLEIFRSPHSGDFSAARIFRYRALELLPEAAVLASYDDGGVALAERRSGGGSVIVWTSALDNFWTDFPVHPVFLPFLHQAVRYLARYRPPRVSYRVGSVADLRQYFAEDEGIEEVVVEGPSGNREVRNLAEGEYGVQLEEAGVYQVRRVNSQQSPIALIAVNVDPEESDLSRIDPDEIVRAVTVAATGASGELGPQSLTDLAPEARERRQRLWWYLLLGALVLLAAESVMARRYGSRRG